MSAQEWLGRVAKVLGDQDFSTLRSVTPEGLTLEPLYPVPPEAASRAVRAQPDRPFAIVQRIDDPLPDSAARQAAEDLQGGADILTLCLEGSDGAHGFGVRTGDMAAVLRGIDLDRQRLRIEPAPGAVPEMLEGLAAHLSAARLPAALSTISIAADPARLSTAEMGALLASGLPGTLVTASGCPHHDRGADGALELAAVLSSAVAGLRAMDAAGLSPEAARERLALELSADADLFLTISKFRAARLLWADIALAIGMDAEPVELWAQTSFRMQARKDAATNMLRNALAGFGSAIGGADRLTILPHTLALGLPDAFARRIARNQSVILIEESHVCAVADPAAGAGAFEAMTAQLADRAWSLFQDIEAEGGIRAMVSDGRWAERLAQAHAQRQAQIAAGAKAILGVTLYPDASERGAPLARPREPGTDPLMALRDAAPFEEQDPV
ncbi:methylmalonyl-CoA mutase family protein [Aureimonas frigidaquae]|uniref:Methylmalonyl-CoA mutase, N-terminal domain/subunit n=1 Tax=Aureimonas frigidaquae TaxID=424757 RepID=A0A0P0Z2X5_9HYPH|nr:methylmalonyl-CoA mutase family protein [Aureimonas frigidaquae]BAT28091.1 methylmalonyl-CoA mutase, N-terminal domain/subunit [Aureimonas frigidaquae]